MRPWPAPMVRIMSKTTEQPGPLETPCWVFAGALERGYGRIKIGGRRFGVHRVVYEHMVGPVDPDLELDHLCRVRACCNPDHLEPVTTRVNGHRSHSPWGLNVRKTHCLRGHEFNEVNTKLVPGGRSCRECIRIRQKAGQARRTETQRARRAARRQEVA